VNVRFVDIGDIVEHYCLLITKKNDNCYLEVYYLHTRAHGIDTETNQNVDIKISAHDPFLE
jgi:hypothetical protein